MRKKIDGKDILKIILAGSVIVIGILIAVLNKSSLLAMGINKSALVQTLIWGTGLALLIVCFFVIQNTKANIFLGLTYLLFTGTSQISYFSNSGGGADLSGTLEYFTSYAFKIDLANMAVKAALSLIVSAAIAFYALKKVEREESKEWMRETWTFVKKIFPYQEYSEHPF